MQKRELNKSGVSAGGATAAQISKRGRPLGSTVGNSTTAALSLAGDTAAPLTLLGPSLQVHASFTEQNYKRIVLALQSGLKSEIIWALNALTLLSFREKEDLRKDSLAKIPGLLDVLLQVIDDWRDIGLSKKVRSLPRPRTLGSNLMVTGFGKDYEGLASGAAANHANNVYVAMHDSSSSVNLPRAGTSDWCFCEDGPFNLDEEGRTEKQLCAVAASNIIRNFSFMPENEALMAQNRHCLETVFQCVEDHLTEDEELVTNSLETIVNLSLMLDLHIFSSAKPSYIKITEKQAVQSIVGMLSSTIKAWHCAAAELVGRLMINPDNEPFLLPFVPQIHVRLVDLLTMQATESQAAAVGALYNLTEVNVDCRLKLASERWAIDRLLRVIKAPHPVPEISRKAAVVLENLVSEPQNRALLLAYENSFAEIIFSDSRHASAFARILFELTARPTNKFSAARGIWGM